MLGGWGRGAGGLGLGDRALPPIPNPQSPIPNPHLNLVKKFCIISNLIILLYYIIFIKIRL